MTSLNCGFFHWYSYSKKEKKTPTEQLLWKNNARCSEHTVVDGTQRGNWNRELLCSMDFTSLSLEIIRSRLLQPGESALSCSPFVYECVCYVSIWGCVCICLYVVSVFQLGLKSIVLVLCLQIRLHEGTSPQQVLFLPPTPSTLCSLVGSQWWVVFSISPFPVFISGTVTRNYVDKNAGCWIIYVSFLLLSEIYL